MPTLEELLADYNQNTQKSKFLVKPTPENINIGFGAAEEQDIPFSSKDLGQSIYEEVESWICRWFSWYR